MKKGDIYYVDLGNGIGSEQEGVRPCVIVQNNIGNLHSNTVILCPITSKPKHILPTHVHIMLKKPSVILCEHIRTVDKNRLINRIGQVDSKIADTALLTSLGIGLNIKKGDVI